jgi:hypothetical protein
LADLLLLPLLALLVGAGWVVGLRWLGMYSDPAVLAWRRLARLRGLDRRRPLGDRLGGRLPVLRRLQAETDVGRLLAIAGRDETPTVWLLRTLTYAGALLVGWLALDEVILVTEHEPGPPPALGLLVAGGIAALSYVHLRNQAVARQRLLGRAIADSLPHLAVMTYHHRLPVSEALLVFARCQQDPSLYRFLSEGLWHRLADQEIDPAGVVTPGTPGAAATHGPPATAALYERIGRIYQVPMFLALGSALNMVNERGLSGQQVLTRLASDTLNDRAAEARVTAAQTKTLIVVPMGLMIIPILVLIGAPVVTNLATLFAR